MPDVRTMTIQQQAEFLQYLVDRCAAVSPGMVTVEAQFWLTADEITDLKYVADRLLMMVPHAQEIRRVVLGE